MKKLQYEIHFQNQDVIRGNLKCLIGQPAVNVKRKILEIQQLPKEEFIIEQNKRQSITLHMQKLVLTQSPKKRKKKSFSEDQIQIVQDDSSFLDAEQKIEVIQEEPQKPPKVSGYINEPRSLFFCFSKRRFMKLTLFQLHFSAGQNNPSLEIIKLASIKNVNSYIRGDNFCLKITTPQKSIDLKFTNKNICKQWMNYLIQAIQYVRFIQLKKSYLNTDSMNKFLSVLFQSEKSSNALVKLEDSEADFFEKRSTKTAYSKNINDSFFPNPPQKIIKLKQFKVTHRLGSGAFSTVYKAEKGGKIMALKQISKSQIIRKNLLKYSLTELSILKQSKHPFIVKLYYAFQTYEYIYLAIRYLPYGTLKNYIEKKGKLNIRQALFILEEIVIAIEYLHKKNFLYRDMKPENILFGQHGHICLTDFGLAKQLKEDQNLASSFLGTPLYLAPQRFSLGGNLEGIDKKSDLYGIGCIFYQMLHGVSPFYGQSFHEVIFNIRNNDPAIDEKLPEVYKNFLKVTLQKDPNKRIEKLSTHEIFMKTDWKSVYQKKIANKDFEQFQLSEIEIDYKIDTDYDESNFAEQRVKGWNYCYLDKQ